MSSSKSVRARKQPERLTEVHPPSKSPASKPAGKALSKGSATSKGKGQSKITIGAKATKLSKKATKGAKSATKGTKTKKTRTSPSRRATKGSKRSVPSMVLAAIGTLATRGGSSYQAIENQIVATHPEMVGPAATREQVYGMDYNKQDFERRRRAGLHVKVMRALRKLETDGHIERSGHSYKLTAKAKRGTTRKGSATKGRTSRMPPKNDGEKKVKKEKDPNKPKRPLTAFMFFSKDMRATVKAENPSMTFGELGSAIAARWAKATPADKKKYEGQAAKDKVRYETAMASYKPPEGSLAAKKAAKPKRALNAYNIFQSEEMARVRAANPGMEQTEVMRLVAAEWKKITPADKKKYQAQALALAGKPTTPKTAAPKAPSPVSKAATPKAPVSKAAAPKASGKTAKK